MSDDEDYAFYGCAVEQLDEDTITARKAPRLEDQIVTDKQGRKRFHGAFTGGFSAGHFNTVGSVEGFTPTTFSSSRTDRNKAATQDVAMFMDDEDVAAHGIAAQHLQTTADFAAASTGGKRKRFMPGSGPIPGMPALLDIVADTSNTIGVRLLQSLGWRQGQGVGPRVLQAEKRRQRRGAADGTSQSDSDDPELPSQYSETTFAPDDSSTVTPLQYKDNTFGLGYTPLSRANILGKRDDWMQDRTFKVTEKKKTITIKGQAFGVGAFEEDDDDIYEEEDMSHYNFTLGGAGACSSAATKDTTGSKTNCSPASVHDITELLEGFLLSASQHAAKAMPPLPLLPPGYQPRHTPRRKRFSSRVFEQQGLGRHDLTHADRQRILEGAAKPANVEVRVGVKGQKPPSPPPSEPNTATQASAAADPSVTPTTSEEQSDLLDVVMAEVESAPQNQSPDYKPFAKYPEKQKRYEIYMRLKDKGLADRYGEVQLGALTEWEKAREQQEFGKAAHLYKPLHRAMSTRFVTSSVTEGTPLLKDGLNMNIKKLVSSVQIKAEPDSETAPSTSAATAGGATAPDANSDSRVAAALTGMFGRLTQLVQDWHPDKLLSKRFNVPPAYPDSRFTGVVSIEQDLKKPNIFNCLLNTPTLADRKRARAFKDTEASCSTNAVAGINLMQRGLPAGAEPRDPEQGENLENYGLKVSTDGPPTMDLFKAIFDDSSSESDSDSDENSTRDENIGTSDSILKTTNSTSNDKVTDNLNSQPIVEKVRNSRFEPIESDYITNNRPGDSESNRKSVPCAASDKSKKDDSNKEPSEKSRKDDSNERPSEKSEEDDYNKEPSEKSRKDDSNKRPSEKSRKYDSNERPSEKSLEEDHNKEPSEKSREDYSNKEPSEKSREDYSNKEPSEKFRKDNSNERPSEKSRKDDSNKELSEKSRKDDSNNEAPRHLFISRKSKQRSTADDIDNNSDSGDADSHRKNSKVKVSLVKGVKGKKKSSRNISKSSLSFVVESESTDDDKAYSKRCDAKQKSNVKHLSMANYLDKDKKTELRSREGFHLSESSERESQQDSVHKSGVNYSSVPNNSSMEQTPVQLMDISEKVPMGKSKEIPSSNNCTLKKSIKSNNVALNISAKSSPEPDLQKPLKLSQSSATGIFANIDFAELNKYRNFIDEDPKDNAELRSRSNQESSQKSPDFHVQHSSRNEAQESLNAVRGVTKHKSGNKSGEEKDQSCNDSDSSTNSDDAYGAALPPDFVNQMQLIRGLNESKKVASDSNYTLSLSKKEKVSHSKHKHHKKKEKKSKKSRHKSKSRKKEKGKKYKKENKNTRYSSASTDS